METMIAAGIMSAQTAATLSTVASVASVGLSAVSMLGQMSAGNQDAAMYEQKALDQEVQARQDEIDGRESALGALTQLNKDLAGMTVAGYASGVTSSGSIESARDQAQEEADYQIGIIRSNTEINAAGRRSQAAQERLNASGAKTSGQLGAINTGINLFDRVSKRGVAGE